MKYKPLHEWVKEAGLSGSIAQIMDSATDHIGKIIDRLSVKDVIYVAVFLIGSWYLYNEIGRTKTAVASMNWQNFFTNIVTFSPLMSIFRGRWSTIFGTDLGEVLPPEVLNGENPAPFDPGTLAQAVIATYLILKVDIDDVTSAISALSGAIGKVI